VEYNHDDSLLNEMKENYTSLENVVEV